MADDTRAGEAGGFLSRWARRKQQARSGGAAVLESMPEPVAAGPVGTPPRVRPAAAFVAEVAPAANAASAANVTNVTNADPKSLDPPPAAPSPTMADVALLTRESDYARFVAPGIDEGVKQAAMRKLFTDPHFNVMDGLDTYIDDYGKPDPIPLAMLRQMNQSRFLGLFDDDEDEAIHETKSAQLTPAARITEPTPSPDDDPDLQLQQDDAPGRAGADQGTRP